MNEQIQTISTSGYAVQPSNPATPAGEDNSERNRSSKLNVQETELQLDETQQDKTQQNQEALSEKEMETLFSEVQEKYQQKGMELHFSVHEETGQIQVEVVNSADDKVIRKIPRDEMLKLSAQIKEMAGTLLDRSI